MLESFIIKLFRLTVHREKKTIQEDFDECFAGLDETTSLQQQQDEQDPSSSIVHQVIEETGITACEENQVENMAYDHDEFLNSLDDAPAGDGAVDEVGPEKQENYPRENEQV